MRKICLIEKTQRDRDEVRPLIDHIGHCRSAARAKPVSDLASTIGGSRELEPVPHDSDGVDRKANLGRKSAPGPLLAGSAVTDGNSDRLTQAIRSEATATA
jgi:hypothetical protein